MALICKDIFRDCIYAASDYYDYGLWMPADQYREDSPHEHSLRSAESSSSSESSIPVSPAPPPSKVQAAWAKVSGGTTTVTANHAGDVARFLGYAPSQQDIRQLKDAQGDSVSMREFEQWLNSITHTEDSNTEYLIQFFKLYDLNNSGVLTIGQLRNLLRTYGEPLTDSELDSILRELGIQGSSPVDYRELVEALN